MKKVCIDARFWGVKHTGIGRYVENLIDNLPDNPKIKMVLIVHPDQRDEPKLAKFEKYYAKRHPYSIGSLFEMAWILLQVRPDILHVLHIVVPWFWPGKIIVTIHDLIKHYSPGPKSSTKGPIVYWLKYMQYLAMSWASIVRANHIFVPSNYWKQEIIARYGIASKKITVTYEGVDHQLFGGKSAEIDLPDHKPYILYVGNVYPHKNIPVLLEAIKLLKGEVLLVLVCARSVFTQRVEKIIQEKNLTKHVKLWGYVPDELLVSLYQNALAFVFPSLIEGFGLPGVESMAAGTPVIAANSSCLPEVYGDAALFFDPTNSQELAEKIQLLNTKPSVRKSLIAKGKQRVKKYTWPKMANEVWTVYQQELR